MGSTCVVGLQWGDEAKGKIVDLLCDQHDVVVRYQGGANAGHTVVVDGVTYKLSLVPTGILRPGVDAVIGNGVVIHPPALLREIETLAAQGIDVGRRLHVSDRAHVILPYHLEEERLTEESAFEGRPSGDDAPGDRPMLSRQGRPGARSADRRPLSRRRHFATGWRESSITRTGSWARCSRISSRSTPRAVADEYLGHAERLRPFVRDTTAWLHQALEGGRRLLFEGAQGSLLDVDHGSYPYVTSSNSSAAGIAAGSGVPTRHIDRWIGVVKAYTTRVGGGPFPDRARQRDRRADPARRQGVRNGHRPAAPLRMVRRRRRAPRGQDQRLDRAGRHAPGCL